MKDFLLYKVNILSSSGSGSGQEGQSQVRYSSENSQLKDLDLSYTIFLAPSGAQGVTMFIRSSVRLFVRPFVRPSGPSLSSRQTEPKILRK